MTFVRTHAQAILACDFFTTVTASFHVLYVFVIMEVDTRRITHFNVTSYPTPDWTLQQFREAITGEEAHRFIIHDRASVYSSELDLALQAMGLSILKTPFRAPQAKDYASYCTSLVRFEGFSKSRGLSESFTPCILHGGFSPGSSYKHSFLSL